MGARKWVRGESSQGPTTSAVVAPTATPQRRGPRKLVWQRQQPVQQPANPSNAQHAATEGQSGLKRPSDSQSSERPPGKTLKADASQTAPAGHPSSVPQQAAASNPAPPHAAANGGEQAASLKKAEMEQLQQKIQQKQAELRAQLQGSNAVEAQRQQQKARDKARLDAGFSEEFRRARVAASMAAAQQRQQHHREAELDDAAEVARVLAAKSHLECLQLRAGASHSDVKGKYHELARLLHPDKCKVPRSTDAFQRLVQAYQSLLATTS